MQPGTGGGPPLADVAIEVVNGLNPLLAIPDACDLLAAATDASPARAAEAPSGWITCADGADSRFGPRNLLVYGRFASRDRVADLVADSPGVPGVGALTPRGARWGADDDGSGVAAVAVSCEPIAFVATAASAAEAGELADRVGDLACPARLADGGAP
jgi:hypothetical protein